MEADVKRTKVAEGSSHPSLHQDKPPITTAFRAVPRKCDPDSLHGSLAAVLGSFPEVAPFLRQQKGNQQHTLLGVTHSPPTPRTPAVDQAPLNFFSESRPNKDSKRHQKEKSRTSKSRDKKQKQKSGSDHASREKGKGHKKSAHSEKNGSGSDRVLPPLKLPGPATKSSECRTPPRDKVAEKDVGTPALKQMVKNMQSLVATPLTKVKEEPFEYPDQSITVSALKEFKEEKASVGVEIKCRDTAKVTKKSALGLLKADLQLSEESSDSDGESTSKHVGKLKRDGPDRKTMPSSSSQDPWTVDNFFGVSHKTGTSSDQEYKRDTDSKSKSKSEKAKSFSSPSVDSRKKEKRAKRAKKLTEEREEEFECASASVRLNQGSVDEPQEDVQSPDSGFVDGGSPGKENVGGEDGSGKTGQGESKISAQTVLQESRVSPLLSPIPEFPPLVYRENGEPSLMCRISLSLLDKITDEGAKQGPMERRNGFHYPAISKLNTTEELPVSAAVTEDWDEMPLDKRKEDKKNRKRKLSPDGPEQKKPDMNHLAAPPKLSPIEPRPEEGNDKKKKRETTEEAEKNTKGKHSPKSDNRTETEAKAAPVTLPKNLGAESNFSASQNETAWDSCGIPVKKVEIEGDLLSADYYLGKKAKPIKHQADGLPSQSPSKILLYLESIVYFVMAVRALEKEVVKESSRPYHMAKETYELLRQVTQRFSSQVSTQRADESARIFVSRIGVLSLRAQAVICYKLYSMRQSQIFRNYRTITEYNERQKKNGTPQEPLCPPPPTSSTPSPTPSPASSSGSSSANSLPVGHVAVPQNMDQLYKQQLNYLHSLMLAHRHWEAAEEHLRPEDRDLFARLECLCGGLTIQSSWSDLCVYLLTAVEWLKNPHPPAKH